MQASIHVCPTLRSAGMSMMPPIIIAERAIRRLATQR